MASFVDTTPPQRCRERAGSIRHTGKERPERSASTAPGHVFSDVHPLLRALLFRTFTAPPRELIGG